MVTVAISSCLTCVVAMVSSEMIRLMNENRKVKKRSDIFCMCEDENVLV